MYFQGNVTSTDKIILLKLKQIGKWKLKTNKRWKWSNYVKNYCV